MLETITQGFRNARMKLQGKAVISEDNIKDALRDIRMSLLEADVEFGVAKRFLDRVRAKALGEVVNVKVKSKRGALKVSPAEHFVKICQDELEALMGPVETDISWQTGRKPTVVMMVGLQGSGKTTTTGKLATLFKSQGKNPVLVAADIYRPAAVQQLRVLGERVGVPVYHRPGASPPELATEGVGVALRDGHDVVILDTAGRLAIDETMMKELELVKTRTEPNEIFFVCDAMIGQDAVKTAAEFNRRLEITGFILTKLDGDARGGAALSIKEVTGKPIKFLATGEGMDKLEEFRPEGLASRILGMGDIVGLVKDFEQHIDEETAEKDARKMLEGQFNFDDFVGQMRMIKRMGSLQDLFERMPFFSDMLPAGFQIDDTELDRIEAIINSMTRDERKIPDILNESRVRRIAKGSGNSVKEVEGLVERFTMARSMMADLGRSTGLLGMLGGGGGAGGGMLSRAARRKLKKKGGNIGSGLPGGMPGGGMPPSMPGGGLPGMGGGMPGMGAMPGMGGMPGMPGMGFEDDNPNAERAKAKRKLKARNKKKKAKKAKKKNRKR